MNNPLNIDVKIIVALITALVTITVFFFTKVIESISKYKDKKRNDRMHIMSIKSEMEINLYICNKMLDHPKDIRTLGFRFIDSTWNNADKSVIYTKGIKSEKILDIYSKIQQFYLLTERRKAIQEQGDYPSAEKVLQIERNEMFNLVKELKAVLEEKLDEIR